MTIVSFLFFRNSSPGCSLAAAMASGPSERLDGRDAKLLGHEDGLVGMLNATVVTNVFVLNQIDGTVGSELVFERFHEADRLGRAHPRVVLRRKRHDGLGSSEPRNGRERGVAPDHRERFARIDDVSVVV